MSDKATNRLPGAGLVIALVLTAAWVIFGGPHSQQDIADFRAGVVQIAEAKARMQEVYLDTGNIPRSNRGAGLDEPGSYRNGNLEYVVVRDNGAIQIGYTELFDVAQGIIAFQPIRDPIRQQISGWECFSPNIRHIQEVLVQCRYLPDN